MNPDRCGTRSRVVHGGEQEPARETDQCADEKAAQNGGGSACDPANDVHGDTPYWINARVGGDFFAPRPGNAYDESPRRRSLEVSARPPRPDNGDSEDESEASTRESLRVELPNGSCPRIKKARR